MSLGSWHRQATLSAAIAALAAPAFAQIMQKPVYPRVGPFGFANVPMRSFESYRDFYASIAPGASAMFGFCVNY